MPITPSSAQSSACPTGPDTFSVLLVTAEALEGEAAHAVRAEIDQRAKGREAAVHVISPILASSGLKHQMNDVDEEREPALERLRTSVAALQAEGLAVAGELGDPDPVQAINDEMQKYGVDHILVLTHDRDEESAYAEKELFERVAEEFEETATELRIRGHGRDERIADRNEAPAGSERARGGHKPDENLPPLRRLDMFGLLVAAVGTIALVLVASSCEEHGRQDGAGAAEWHCAAIYLIAGAFFLINIAHVVGLLLMQAVNYRGPFERFFARISLFGTPIALLAAIAIQRF